MTENIAKKLTLNHFLAQSGLCSRRHAVEMIADGRVRVNGEICTNPGYRVESTDIVEADTQTITADDTAKEKGFVYLALNKPEGYECSRPSRFATQTIFDLVKIPNRRLFSVGRLDKNSEGMIILTDDGDFANHLTHPSHQIEKTYVLKTKLPLTSFHLDKIRQGIEDEGDFLQVKSITPRKAPYVWEVVLTEGKKREIRRIVRAVDNHTVRLTRIGIGKLFMHGLPKGEWAYLDQDDLNLILS